MYNDAFTKEEAIEILDNLVASDTAKLHEWSEYWAYEKGEIDEKDVTTWLASARKENGKYHIGGYTYDPEGDNFTGAVFELMEFKLHSW